MSQRFFVLASTSGTVPQHRSEMRPFMGPGYKRAPTIVARMAGRTRDERTRAEHESMIFCVDNDDEFAQRVGKAVRKFEDKLQRRLGR